MSITDMIQAWYSEGFEGRHPVSSSNDYGEDVVTYPTAADYTFDGAIRQMSAGDRFTAGVHGFTSTHRLYCATDTAVVEGDRITYDGRNYKVVAINDVMMRGEMLQVDVEWLV